MRMIPALVCLALLAAPAAQAARLHHAPLLRHHQQHQESQTAPEPRPETREVQNKFFSITLPEGWKLQKPVMPVGDRVSAVFIKGPAVRVALNIFKSPFAAKLMAEKTADGMRKRGMEVSQPVEKDGFYVVDISKKGVRGKGWFGSNGSTGASTIIFAPDLAEADELLKALKMATPSLAPQSVD